MAENQRRAATVAAAFFLAIAAVVFVVLALVGLGLTAVVVAVIVAGVSTFLAYWYADAVALRTTEASPADPTTHARLHNLVDGLCVASGLAKPELYVIDDPAPNALALGRNPKHAALVVTTGLLDSMDRVELEAILAHELSHIRSRDTLVSTLAVTMVGQVTPGLVPVAVGERREARADRAAVELTRFPPALVSALEKLASASASLRRNPRSLAHLWIEAPVCHPPLEERIAVLREL